MEVRVTEKYKSTKIAQDFSSYSRLTKGRIWTKCNLWYNTEDELKDQQDCGINLFRDPKSGFSYKNSVSFNCSEGECTD